MSGTDDSEAYRKGYEDAMRRTAGSPPALDVPAPASTPSAAGAATPARRGVGSKVGYSLGWLIGFPLAFGTLAGFVGLVVGGSFEAFWWGFGVAALLCFCFAVFAGASIIIFRYWPIALGIVLVLYLVSRAT